MSDNILKTAVQGASTFFGGPIGGAIAGALTSSLLSKESPTANVPPPPTPEAPAELPQPKGADVQQAKKRSIVALQKRKGRASTILTDQPSDALGG